MVRSPATEEGIYGIDDATFLAAGGESGVVRLVDSFYTLMAEEERFGSIWRMHSADPEVSRQRLSAFLCGWMGGPRLYHERYGSIRIPQAHSWLAIGEREKSLWLECMREALDCQKYSETLVDYLMAQFEIPAERIRQACASAL